MENHTSDFLWRKAQSLMEDIKEVESIDLEKGYRKTHSIIVDRRKERMKRNLMRTAAILTLPLFLLSGLLTYLLLSPSEEVVRYAEVTAAQGTVVRYELPDHSTVWLNAGSSLRYPTTFKGDDRQVELSGEAYFHVKADTKRPFYVNTHDGLSVYVYGTQFNVSAYPEDDYIETVLEEGKVNVLSSDRSHPVVLKPGEEFYYNKSSRQGTKKIVDVYEKTAWKEGKLIFRNAPLDEVLKRLERHFNVDIVFNNRSGKVYNYRATFRNETLPQILDYLSESAAFKWEMEPSVRQSDDSFTKKKIRVDLY